MSAIIAAAFGPCGVILENAVDAGVVLIAHSGQRTETFDIELTVFRKRVVTDVNTEDLLTTTCVVFCAS